MLEINSFQICSLLRGGIAERGGVRVGHRIIDINNHSVVAVAHEKIVTLLATSIGEVNNPLIILQFLVSLVLMNIIYTSNNIS